MFGSACLGYQLSSCVGCTRYVLVPLSPGCTGGRSASSPDASTASSNVLKEAGFATELIRAALLLSGCCTSSACCRCISMADRRMDVLPVCTTLGSCAWRRVRGKASR